MKIIDKQQEKKTCKNPGFRPARAIQIQVGENLLHLCLENVASIDIHPVSLVTWVDVLHLPPWQTAQSWDVIMKWARKKTHQTSTKSSNSICTKSGSQILEHQQLQSLELPLTCLKLKPSKAGPQRQRLSHGFWVIRMKRFGVTCRWEVWKMGWLGQAQTQRGNVGNYMNIYIYTHTYTYICVCIHCI